MRNESMTRDFLVCRVCALVCSAATENLADEPEIDSPASDRELFCREHAAHGLEIGIRCTTTAVYDGPIWDPMVTAWFEVQINGDTYLVRSWRASIDEPRCCELSRGVIERGTATVEIDEDYLLLALDRWFFPHVLAPSRCTLFVDKARILIGDLDPDQIETSFDDTDDPEIGIAPFPERLAVKLVQQTRSLFDPVEQERLKRFIDAHRAEDGALALRVRRPLMVRAA